MFKEICRQASVQPTVLQNRFYADSGYDKDLRAFCRDRGIQYQSFWTLTANPKILQSADVTGAARRLRITPAQVFFQFLHHCEGLNPLTGTCNGEHMRQDLDAVSVGCLLT